VIIKLLFRCHRPDVCLKDCGVLRGAQRILKELHTAKQLTTRSYGSRRKWTIFETGLAS
jgi:hypothetical protein